MGVQKKGRRAWMCSSALAVNYCRQRPTLPHSFPCSTIGGIRLNFRVRNGNGCDPDPMTTGILNWSSGHLVSWLIEMQGQLTR